jgi:hypothetical protein
MILLVSYHKLIKKVLALSVTQQIILGLVSGNVERKGIYCKNVIQPC